jgi:ubiquinone/menaquinone biosynthesis C-methylase UbiE
MMASTSSGTESSTNADAKTVVGFGEEWQRFDQSELPADEAERLFRNYFEPVDLTKLSNETVAMDVGCGSGRWARFVAPRVATLHCIDAAPAALDVARSNLAQATNVVFSVSSVDDLPVPDASLDFLYSLGVLHHVPDTKAAIQSCAKKLKPGATMLLYLYYAFDGRSKSFVTVWKVSDAIRRRVSALPLRSRRVVADCIAVGVYWPLAKISKVATKRGRDASSLPLFFYRDKSFYTMRTDALDRFGTRLEHRFTREQIIEMLHAAGMEDVRFREGEPFWCVGATKSTPSTPSTAVR